MINKTDTCHGQEYTLIAGSFPYRPGVILRLFWRLRLYLHHFIWHGKEKGLLSTVKYFSRRNLGRKRKKNISFTKPDNLQQEETLNLKPGEWVEVKSESEILATLDEQGTYKGLRWMCNMRKFCGQKYRVFKRLETILIESTGEYRKVKNTVLLEGVICDGLEWHGCDRSCFHFWREVWLKRAESE